MTALDALVKDTHGFIGRPNLHLHKVRLTVIASRTNSHRPIHVLPGSSSSEDVVHHFTFRIGLDGSRLGNIARVRTSQAEKLIDWVCFPITDLQQRSIQGTEPHISCVDKPLPVAMKQISERIYGWWLSCQSGADGYLALFLSRMKSDYRVTGYLGIREIERR
jgi:hypothetical protein